MFDSDLNAHTDIKYRNIVQLIVYFANCLSFDNIEKIRALSISTILIVMIMYRSNFNGNLTDAIL